MVVDVAVASSAANFHKMMNVGGLNENVLSGFKCSCGGI